MYETYVDEVPIDDDRNLLSAQRYDYYQVASFNRQCVGCHIVTQGLDLDPAAPSQELLEHPAFFRVVKISLPFEVTQRALNRIYAVVLALGIVTVFLGHAGAVRYRPLPDRPAGATPADDQRGGRTRQLRRPGGHRDPR